MALEIEGKHASVINDNTCLFERYCNIVNNNFQVSKINETQKNIN
jgi:hypothetical protein